MARVAAHFKLKKKQGELDFVDVDLDQDTELYIDPFAISQRPDEWSRNCHQILRSFFHEVLAAIKAKDLARARYLLSNLHEPKETRLGLSKGSANGAGIARGQSEELLAALQKSSAVKTGFLENLEESELMIEKVGKDKISDLTTNVIRRELATYTKEQCNLHGIAVQKDVAMPPYYDDEAGEWVATYFDLPVVNRKPLLLVPKAIVRRFPAYSYDAYYGHVIDYLRDVELENPSSSLVKTLKNGKPRVLKRDIKAEFKKTKENLFSFSKKHPKVLKDYRDKLTKLEAKRAIDEMVSHEEQQLLASALATALKSIPKGNDHASEYHDLMVGIVEFIFFPNLTRPRKEVPIHQGRKRIDITMENSATSGVFETLHRVRKLPCGNIAIECKNYTGDPKNPELDQLSSRFAPNRGRAGILLCRSFENRQLFIDRCRDTAVEDRGLIIPMADADVLKILDVIENRERSEIDDILADIIDEVWAS